MVIDKLDTNYKINKTSYINLSEGLEWIIEVDKNAFKHDYDVNRMNSYINNIIALFKGE
jgi:hypothetical protein